MSRFLCREVCLSVSCWCVIRFVLIRVSVWFFLVWLVFLRGWICLAFIVCIW